MRLLLISVPVLLSLGRFAIVCMEREALWSAAACRSFPLLAIDRNSKSGESGAKAPHSKALRAIYMQSKTDPCFAPFHFAGDQREGGKGRKGEEGKSQVT